MANGPGAPFAAWCTIPYHEHQVSGCHSTSCSDIYPESHLIFPIYVADSQEPSNYPPLRSNQESAMCYYQRIWWGCGCYFGVVLLRRCEHRNTPRCQRRHLLDRWHLTTYCPHHRDPPLQLTCSPDNSDDGNRRRRRHRRRHRSHRSQDQRPGSRGATASAAETGDSGEGNSSSGSE
ncbi:uncharacterized protein P884DRAFT_320806 [Thermothelomyces heterothallicus CBS 202.75]|uniref:uncharacterized protein n=1 Tax=Thermothelomyces heterothallicus CBS 202.75 TaxID=1149848 RepID=UPI0037440029